MLHHLKLIRVSATELELRYKGVVTKIIKNSTDLKMGEVLELDGLTDKKIFYKLIGENNG